MRTYRLIYTEEEEKLNYSSHGFATMLSVVGLVVLVLKAIPTGNLWTIAGVAVFGSCMTAAFLSSTIYHYIKEPERKHALRFLDHIAIYLFIAGSYTPFSVLTLPGHVGLFIAATIWTLTVFGISFKYLIRNKLDEYTKVDALLYVVLGCVAILFIKPMLLYLPIKCILMLALGGALYLVGVCFYLKKSIPYNHAIWHLFVMLGALVHYVTVYKYVLP